MWRAAATLALFAALASAHAAAPDLQRQQEQARERREALRADIKALQEEIDRQTASREDAALQLKKTETRISDIRRRLAELEAEAEALQRRLDELESETVAQTQQLALRRDELATQLKAQYASGLSPWMALLSGNDPQDLGRDFSYLGYVTQAQTQAVRAVNASLAHLEQLKTETANKQAELDKALAESDEQKQALEAEQAERERVLRRIDDELRAQRRVAARMAENDKRLGELIGSLEKAIAKQEELARIAEERRRAEAARRAEEARKAEAARKAEEARRIQEARQAADKERLAQAREAAKARERQREIERLAAAKRAEDAARQAQAEREAARSSPRSMPPGGFKGLSVGLPPPVRGEVMGQFGAQRPEGGLWRGIVLRTAEGTPVRAVADGRVVYASWLNGFGNIMIVDHGAQYLSVYAYNQSLLRQVGDIVASGDRIATVGATGGQLEPGLYFEIRHQGKPVNPLLWLRR